MLDALASKVFVISSLLHGNQDLVWGGRRGGGIRFEKWTHASGAMSSVLGPDTPIQRFPCL